MLPILLLVLGPAATSLQGTTAEGPFTTIETIPTAYTTVQQTDADITFPTFRTTLPQNTFARENPKLRNDPSCKNQFLCVFQRKSFLSKGFPPVPSKNLVPPFTDSEEEELKTTEASKTTPSEGETESVFATTLISRATSIRSVKGPLPLRKREKSSGEEKTNAEASNELRSYLPPTNLAPSAARVDLSYLPPKGVLPAAASASLNIARVNFLPAEEVKAAAAQTDLRQAKPESRQKDICSDAFHSFLCTPLRARKRITGALPNNLVPNPAASNTVRNEIATVKPTVSTPKKQPYRSFSTTATTPTRTTPVYAPQPSNVDRSYLPPAPQPSNVDRSYLPPAPQPSNVDRNYLPPAPKSFDASPSFNSINVAKADEVPVPVRKTLPTSTPRPFVQTSIIPFISPKVIEQISLTPKRPKPSTPAPRLFSEQSKKVNAKYFPPPQQIIQKASAAPAFRQSTPSMQIVTEATKTVVTTPISSKSYLPPSPKIEPAAAAQISQAVAPANRIAVPHHDHHEHHHKDICSDPFHSFLCAPLKQRKRITGALPPGFNPQSSNRKEFRIKPESPLKPENTFQSERRIKPTEEVPAANVLSPQTAGYQYPKPTASQSTAGYQYPKPSKPDADIIPREDRLSPSIVSPGYQYPKPSVPFLLPSESQQNRPSTSPISSPSTPAPSIKPQNIGYQYPKPTIPFLLPSESRQSLPSTFSKSVSVPSPSTPVPLLQPQPTGQKVGYQYPKPQIPFLLPSESQLSKPSTPKPLQPESSDQRIGYQYPKPSQEPTLSSGYSYPKPVNQLKLPNEQKSSVFPPLKPSLRDLGSAEFIPVNRIDAKRQVRTGVTGGSPRFGERIRSRAKNQGY